MNPFHATPSSPRGLRGQRRAKTHPSPVSTSSTTSAWDYVQLTPTTWLWTSPAGLRYLVHPDGTTDL